MAISSQYGIPFVRFKIDSAVSFKRFFPMAKRKQFLARRLERIQYDARTTDIYYASKAKLLTYLIHKV